MRGYQANDPQQWLPGEIPPFNTTWHGSKTKYSFEMELEYQHVEAEWRQACSAISHYLNQWWSIIVSPPGPKCSEIISTFSLKKTCLEMSSTEWWPFCLALNMLFCPHRVHLRDEVITWKHFSCLWPFVRGIQRWSIDSAYKKNSSMFCLIYARTNSWTSSRVAGDLRRHDDHVTPQKC